MTTNMQHNISFLFLETYTIIIYKNTAAQNRQVSCDSSENRRYNILRFFPTFRANTDKRNTYTIDRKTSLFGSQLTQMLLIQVDIHDAVALLTANVSVRVRVIIITMGIFCTL